MIPAIKNRNANLYKARIIKNDEFYTQYKDIAKEVNNYKHHFKDKIVYCNCDDPAWSNFPKFFEDNYDALGLKGLLTNHLQSDGSGDFRGKEALAKLAQADIVCTNPPFSLSRQFIAQLMGANPAPLLDTIEQQTDKKFLIISNMSILGLGDIFPLVKSRRLWHGTSKGIIHFDTPKGIIATTSCWITNLEHGQNRPLVLTRKYDPAINRKYENYDAVNVDKIRDIPCDYYGLMGVPTTILLGYDMSEFEIVGISGNTRGMALGIKKYSYLHKQLCIKNGKGWRDGDLYFMIDGKPIAPFRRIIVRRKIPTRPAPAPAPRDKEDNL